MSNSRLVVHGGGHGLATAAVLAGVPQVILAFDIEKILTANFLKERGIAQHVEPAECSPEGLRAAILSALEDPVMEMEAKRAAEEHATYRSRDVAGHVAESCASLL